MALKDRGFLNVTGIDPSPTCVAHVGNQGIRCFVGGLFANEPNWFSAIGGPFDCVILGKSSNVFAVVGGVLRTHAAGERILNGITRARILQLAREAGYPVEERAFSLAEITSGDEPKSEVFITSTLKDIMPVVRLGNDVVADGRPGPVTLALLDLFRRQIALFAGLEMPLASS